MSSPEPLLPPYHAPACLPLSLAHLETVLAQGEEPQLPGFPTEELKPLTVRMVAGVVRDIALQTTRCQLAWGWQGSQATCVLEAENVLIT